MEDVVCERSFLPEYSPQYNKSPFSNYSTESKRRLSEFDIIAFSISFESDYTNLLYILKNADIPLKTNNRDSKHPLVIAGGVACFLNPEPLVPFLDCVLIGEAEAILPGFIEVFKAEKDRKSLLKDLSLNVPGAYVPSFYEAKYDSDNRLLSFNGRFSVPQKVERVISHDMSSMPVCSTILSPHTVFDSKFLIEVGRGCPHGCRFCSAGYIYRPPRFRPLSLLKTCMDEGSMKTDSIGLVGSAILDFPELIELCQYGENKNLNLSFSSFRADVLSLDLIRILKKANVKKVTIAPDAGSERLRKVINKGLTKEHILESVGNLVSIGIFNIKLYFMIGLPTETIDDVEAIVSLCKEIKAIFWKNRKVTKRIGEITVSVNSFVPKPFTPFQWSAMDNVLVLRDKIKRIRQGLKGVPNVKINAENPKRAYIQALLSRGDRRVAKILSSAVNYNGNWARAIKEISLDPDFYITRERPLNELLPWDFINSGVKKSFFKKEYKRALKGQTSPPCPVKSCDKCGVCSI